MVKGEVIRSTPEPMYHRIEALNQSGLCEYDNDPLIFYRKYILREPTDDKDTVASLIGTLSDCLLLEHGGDEEAFLQDFDEKFCLFNGVKSSSQVFPLTDKIFEVVRRHITPQGVVEGDFTVMFQEAFSSLQEESATTSKPMYRGKTWQQGLEDFNKKGRDYYDTLLRSIGKKTVDLRMLDTAKRISNQLLTDDNLGWIFRPQKGVEVLNKVAIEWRSHGFDCKAELDRIHIHHDDKTIYPLDLKCKWDNEAFERSYIYDQYYIQNGWYYEAVCEFAAKEKLDYKVMPLAFIVADSTVNQRRPLLYETSPQHLHEAIKGFTYNYRRRRGISELMDNIEWHQQTGIWNISPENYRNGSIIKLQSYDETKYHETSND